MVGTMIKANVRLDRYSAHLAGNTRRGRGPAPTP